MKYKLWDGDWNRPDLYQAVAFAAAVRTPQAAIVGFSGADAVTHSPSPMGRRRSPSAQLEGRRSLDT